MIGRKKRSRVVFIDGIPIESAILDAGNSVATQEDPAVNPNALKELDPRALFDKYDADGSGGIDLDEFKILLKDLHIQLSEPKALAYFKRCDKMRRGYISFEEFRLALYTCDPKNPNRTMGFAPGQALSPKDLFDMYDRDEQGAIDRATFIEILEFLGHKMPLDRMEGIFAAHEDPDIEMMPYYQFKKVWLTLVDVRAELKNRQEKFSRFLPNAALMKKLEILINEEEKQEAGMLLEAATTLQEERTAAYRRWLVDESVLLSKLALAEAIDAAGQVYVFGKGGFGRFDGEPSIPDFVDFMDYEVVRDLWGARVRPPSVTVDKPLEKKTDKVDSNGHQMEDDQNDDDDEPPQGGVKEAGQIPTKVSRTRVTLNAAAKAFTGRQVSLVTTFLWGKRVSKVALGSAVAYALTDSGEVFCWGGNKRQWRYFYDDATVEVTKEGAKHDRASTETAIGERPMTTRTEMLKQTMPSQVERSQGEYDQLYLRQKYKQTFVKPERRLPTEDQKRCKLQLMGEYFDILPSQSDPEQPNNPEKPSVAKTVLKKEQKDKIKTRNKLKIGKQPSTECSEPAPGADSASPTIDSPLPVAAVPAAPARPVPTYQVLLETVEPDLNVDDLVVALELRGVHLAKQTRMELIDKLGDCLALEIECLGAKFHRHMKEQDKAARRAKHDRQERKFQTIIVKTTVLWNELRILQEDIVKIESQEFTKSEHEYLDMKRKIQQSKQKIKRQAREGHYTVNDQDTLLHLNGLTSRGAPQRFFNGGQALLDIAVGSRHALAVRQTGKLFTWGVGSFGRLGGVRHEREGNRNAYEGDDDINAWHKDIHSPQAIGSLEQLRFRSVCCGFGHSLALTTRGDVYVWGSATHGKLGIGPVPVSAKESFTLTPLRLTLPGKSSVCVRKIACGPSHSALLTTDGSLFVWGTGDGGKLGLGDGRDVGEDRVPRNGGQLKSIEVPTRVGGALAKEKCVDVSCGTAHTVVTTTIHVTGEDESKATGGRVFIAGSSHALGKFTPVFTLLPLQRIDDDSTDATESSSVVITRVSCGNAHTALVSHDGELLTWGNNAGGCTGHPIVLPFVKAPTRVSCLYQYPRNLCLESEGVLASQSSQNASNMAEFALRKFDDQDASCLVAFAQTQQEVCPFWQVSLQFMSRIERIVVVFKRAAASATTTTARSTQRSTKEEIMPLTAKSSTSTQRTSRPPAAQIKYVALISEVPFDDEERGKYSVAKAKSHSIYTTFSLDRDAHDQWVWSVPTDTHGKYVRIQMESGMGMLSLVSVSVIGTRANEYNGPRVSDVSCGEGLTVAICRPLSSVDMVRDRFNRAVRADTNNLWILEQLETFHPFVLDELNSKKKLLANDKEDEKPTCVLCKPKNRCVICLLDDAAFAVEAQKEAKQRQKEREEQHRQQREQEKQRQEEMVRQQQEMIRGGSRGRVDNKNRESEKRKAARDAKAKAAKEAAAAAASLGSVAVEGSVQVLKRTITLEEKCQKLMTMNMRTEEEEEEAEKRLAAELFAIDPIAAAAAAAKEKQKAIQQNNQTNDSGGNNTATTDLVAKDPRQARRSVFVRFKSIFSASTKPQASSVLGSSVSTSPSTVKTSST